MRRSTLEMLLSILLYGGLSPSGYGQADRLRHDPSASSPGPTFANSLGMEMVLVPAGEFMMGSRLSASEVVKRFGGQVSYCEDEHPRHRVRISKPFYLAADEVTVGQFRRFVKATGYQTEAEREGWASGIKGGRRQRVNGLNWKTPGFDQGDDHPVVCVTWNDAVAFCEWLTQQEGRGYRLPTEAEREYACRAGANTIFWWGDNVDSTGHVANVLDFAHWDSLGPRATMPMDDDAKYTSPIKKYRPNALGLRDMLGNVYEWCSDFYGSYELRDQVNPTGPSNGEYRACRGCSSICRPVACRAASRGCAKPSERFDNTGLRVACEAEHRISP